MSCCTGSEGTVVIVPRGTEPHKIAVYREMLHDCVNQIAELAAKQDVFRERFREMTGQYPADPKTGQECLKDLYVTLRQTEHDLAKSVRTLRDSVEWDPRDPEDIEGIIEKMRRKK